MPIRQIRRFSASLVLTTTAIFTVALTGCSDPGVTQSTPTAVDRSKLHSVPGPNEVESTNRSKAASARASEASLVDLAPFRTEATQQAVDTSSTLSQYSAASAMASALPSAAPPIAKLTAAGHLEYEKNTISVFKAAAPATVFVSTKQFKVDRWRRRTQERQSGSGTGFVWNKQGYIVSNAHVIASRSRNTSYEVTLYSGESYDAKLVGVDPAKDIAVLKIDAPAQILKPIELPAISSKPVVGEKALAIGNPFGLDHTLTVGVVSALGREVKGFGNVTIHGMIQTDASINPGNSGGPLLNSAGHLLGMNTIIISKSGSSSGIGFAVPASIIRRTVPELIEYGVPIRAGLGVDIVDDALASDNGVRRGVVVRSVQQNSPAHRAGLRGLRRTNRGVYLGDIIVGIDQRPVTSYDDLYNALDHYRPGDSVDVQVLRDNKPKTVRIKLTDVNSPRRR